MAKPAPLDQINRLLGAKKRLEYPSGIALKGLHHFMLIKELKWKSPEKNSDAFNGAQSGQSNFENITSGNESKDYYEEGQNFILHLPPGSLKTQYSADYADVNLGIFGGWLIFSPVGEPLENTSQLTWAKIFSNNIRVLRRVIIKIEFSLKKGKKKKQQ